MANSTTAPPATAMQRAFEVLAVVGLIGTVAPLAYYWRRLPDVVPVHFGFDGIPDGAGGPGTYVFVAALSVVFYIVLTLVSKYAPKLSNSGGPPLTPLEARHTRTIVAMCKAFTTLLLAGTLWGAIQVALGHADGLGAWLAPVCVAFVIILIAMSIRMKRERGRQKETTYAKRTP